MSTSSNEEGVRLCHVKIGLWNIGLREQSERSEQDGVFRPRLRRIIFLIG